MTVFQAAVLGVVQGLTEFLPISSSAHLILVRAFLGWEVATDEIAFDVACHLGTLVAVLVFFRDEIMALVAAAPGALVGRAGGAARCGRLIVVATVPIALLGWLGADLIERLREPAVAAAALATGAVVMLAAERVGAHRRDASSLSLMEAVGLGMAQAVALVPGVSRSGAVITVALLTGLRREEAARFTFLLGVPAIFGAAVSAAWTLGSVGLAEHALVLGVGFAVSGVVGYWTVAGLIRYLARHTLDLFACYRLALAAVIGVWLM